MTGRERETLRVSEFRTSEGARKIVRHAPRSWDDCQRRERVAWERMIAHEQGRLRR